MGTYTLSGDNEMLLFDFYVFKHHFEKFDSAITDIDLSKKMREFIDLFEKAIYQHSIDLYSGKGIDHYNRPCDRLFQQIGIFLAEFEASSPEAPIFTRLNRCLEKFDLSPKALAGIKRFIKLIETILHTHGDSVSLLRNVFYSTYEYMPKLDESIASDDSL